MLYLTLFTQSLSSANIDQSAPNLVKIFMSNRIWMNSIMGPIGPEQLELFVLELRKNCDIQLCLLSSIYIYKPISTKLHHNEYEHRSQMSLIMGQVIPDQWVLSALEIEKLNFSSLFGIYFHCYPVLFSTQVSDIGPSWSSCFKSMVLFQGPGWTSLGVCL